ncbi:MarR family transcriptional regulator [Hephaestia caeni]|uniref:MarR family transcriptional regulator n=1 Tax=Hephaestia caeni TaxID=645617 RepID=A0A397NTD7_9SPHN|nr:MarR family transcriptional regulator [Hephaestia caeni]RIA37985.1 MarR family transcriptional regulator [Hephaestia caeni]
MLPTTASARATPLLTDAADAVLEAERYTLQHSFSYLLCTLYRDLISATDRRTGVEGITAAQWRFLRTLYVEDGLTQRELARRVGLREPTTLRSLQRLEEQGLVSRDSDPVNRHKKCVRITDAGRSQVSALLPAIMQINQTALDGFDAGEEQQFKTLLVRAIRSLQGDLAKSEDR